MRVLAAVSILFLVASSPAAAQPTPALKCSSAKLKAVGKDGDGNLKCYAKALTRNEAVDGACLAKSRSKHDDKFAKAESKGGCTTTGDADDLALITDDFVADVVAAIPAGGDDDSRKCASSKERAAGKEAKALAGCAAKGALDNASPEGACVAKAQQKYDDAFAKAEAKGGCASTGDADAIELLVDAYVDAMRGALVAICGDDITGPGEACDGTSDAACPGECLSICVCAGDCGNGVTEAPGEECDDGDLDDGDGCSSLCQLEDRSAACAGMPSTPGTALGVELVASGLDEPVFITAPPLDPRRVFVVEQPGVIRLVLDGVLQGTPFLDISGPVNDSGNEEGLLSMAFHPDYEDNGFFYVYYTNGSGNQVIARYEATSDDVADDTSEEILITVPHPGQSNHNGGQLQFGDDGYLYAGIGDGGGGGDPFETGQFDGDLRGKLLRMDVDTNINTAPFWSPPPDNPDPGAPGDLGSIWSKGLRNPWRFSFDRVTDDLYIADVGQGNIEEIDYTPAPRTGDDNYGWDIFEGTDCFEPAPDPDCPDPPTGFTFPVLEYTHAEGCSVTGGSVYRGCAMPDVDGTYFYSDYCSGWIRTFEVIGGVAMNEDDKTTELENEGYSTGNTSSFGEDARGEIYIATHGGSVWKIVPGP